MHPVRTERGTDMPNNHIITYHDDSERAGEGKKAKPATKSWAKCSCGNWTSSKVSGGLNSTRGSLQRTANTHLTSV